MPVSLCNKAVHACHLQSASSFHDVHERHLCKDTLLLRDRWQRWLALALQCVYCNEPLPLYLNHLRACADSYTNISRGVHSRAVFISLRALDSAAFIRGRRSFKGGVQSLIPFCWFKRTHIHNKHLTVAFGKIERAWLTLN